MSEKIVVPSLGESVTEATVSKWLKTPGDSIISDEPLVELETDKVNVEVPSPSNGVLENIKVNEGETVNVGSLLGTISKTQKTVSVEDNDSKTYNPPSRKKQEKTVVKVFEDSRDEEQDETPLVLDDLHQEETEAPLVLNDSPQEEKSFVEKDLKVSPSARKIAIEKKN